MADIYEIRMFPLINVPLAQSGTPASAKAWVSQQLQDNTTDFVSYQADKATLVNGRYQVDGIWEVTPGEIAISTIEATFLTRLTTIFGTNLLSNKVEFLSLVHA